MDGSQKATSTPLNPKSQSVEPRKGILGIEQYLVFLVKREESRSFDVFLGVFLVFGREKSV